MTISAPGCAASSRYAAAMTARPKSVASSAAARSEWDWLPTYTGDRKKPPGKTMASTGCQSTRLTTASTTWSSSRIDRPLCFGRFGLRLSTHTVTTRGGRMTVPPAWEEASAVVDDERAYTMFQSYDRPPRPTCFGSCLPCCSLDVSFCRRGYCVGYCHADRLQGIRLPGRGCASRSVSATGNRPWDQAGRALQPAARGSEHGCSR
jgi:hypothetical protein